jgi:hypothetical protein
VAGCDECGDEPSGSCATGLVLYLFIYIYIYIYMCVCVCVCVYVYIYIYIYMCVVLVSLFCARGIEGYSGPWPHNFLGAAFGKLRGELSLERSRH